MRSTILTVTLILLSWTALYAQTGTDTSDVVCYTQSELLKIANKMIHANECDSLYGIATKQLQLKTEQGYAYRVALEAKDKELASAKSVVVLKEKIIAGKDEEIGGLRDVIKKDNRKLKWTRIGWISTSAMFTYLILRN